MASQNPSAFRNNMSDNYIEDLCANNKYVAKEGDTMEPGTKIAVISKSAIKEDKPRAKIEASPAVKKPKARPPSPPKRTATELILPPKEREERD